MSSCKGNVEVTSTLVLIVFIFDTHRHRFDIKRESYLSENRNCCLRFLSFHSHFINRISQNRALFTFRTSLLPISLFT